MKRAPWLVVTGAVAGFLGVVGLHKTAAPSALASSGTQPASKASPAASHSQPGGVREGRARGRPGGHGDHAGCP
jgi:hypothetical protein